MEALFKLVQELDDEAHRAVREGLDEESLAIFDLLNKPDLNSSDIQRIKTVATQLLARLKEEKLRVDQWREKEATRDVVRQAIHDFLWSEDTGLPVDCFAEADVEVKTADVFRHIYRAYPTLPSPYFSAHATV
ncbi:MAG: type I restriction enzyme endonuclease domain-containing protein [Nitrospirales bacterium]